MDFIAQILRASGYGAFIGKFYLGCLLYADDILLVAHSLCVMQMMLDICSQEASSLDFSFNTVKSVALRIGPRYKYVCAPLTLSGANLVFVDKTKYLGVMLLAARTFKCSFEIKYYRCFHAIYCKAMHSGSELVCVQLVKSMCLPILLYAIEAVQPARSTLLMLDNILNRSVFRIFGCSNADDICFIRASACIEDIAHYRHLSVCL